MKAVPKSTIPPGLDAYRTAKPRETWDKFRDEEATSYQEVKTQLRKAQGRLCAYCELSLEESNEQVAHFHPKSDSLSEINWAFEWGNLWLACKGGSQTWMKDPIAFLPPLPDNLSCDEVKGSSILDGLVLAPNEIPAFPRIFQYKYSDDGKRLSIHADLIECKKANISVALVERTIKEFNLNCQRLCAARLTFAKGVEKDIKSLRISSRPAQAGMSALAAKYLSLNSSGWSRSFFTVARWCLRNAAEQHLQSIGYTG